MVLVASLLTGILAGFASAADPRAASTTPNSFPSQFGIGGIHEGDAGLYMHSVVRKTPNGEQVVVPESRYAGFEWLPDRTLLDAHGAPRLVNAVRVTEYAPENGKQNLAGGGNVTYYVDPTTHGVVAATHASQRWDVLREEPFPLLPRSTEYDLNSEQTDFRDPAEEGVELLCGLYNHLQGQTHNPQDKVRLFEPCRLGDHQLDKVEFTGRRLAHVTGHEAIEFTSESATSADGFMPRSLGVSAWFTPPTSFPLRVEIRSSDGTVEIFRLAGFKTGSAPVATATPPSSSFLQLDWTERQAWGPADSEIEHPFSLSQAYERLVNDPDYRQFRNYLIQHPTAFVWSADFWGADMDGRTTWSWRIEATDGRDSVTACTEKTVEYPLNYIVDIPSPAKELTAVTTYASRDCPPSRTAPALTAPPERMPTVASAVAFWKAVASPQYASEEPNAWSFSLRCDPARCQETVTTHLTVGYRAAYDSLRLDRFLLEGGRQYAVSGSEASIDDQGRLYSLFESAHRLTTHTHPALLPASPQAPSEDGDDLNALSSKIENGAWSLPTGAYIVGVGIAALMAGAICWFVSGLKGAALVPLYSRVEKPEALRHPVRAQLAALIEAEPGIHFKALARRLGLGNGQAEYHLGKLVQLDLVTRQSGSGFNCYFLKGKVDRRIMGASGVLKAAGARAILAAIVARPGSSASNLVQATGLSAPTVHYHVNRLRLADLVASNRSSKEIFVSPTEAGLMACAAVRVV